MTYDRNNNNYFTKFGPYPASFSLLFLYNTADSWQELSWTGFEPQNFRIRIKSSTNWAAVLLQWNWSKAELGIWREKVIPRLSPFQRSILVLASVFLAIDTSHFKSLRELVRCKKCSHKIWKNTTKHLSLCEPWAVAWAPGEIEVKREKPFKGTLIDTDSPSYRFRDHQCSLTLTSAYNTQVSCEHNKNIIVRLYFGDLHAVSWGEGPRALATKIKDTGAGVQGF